MKKPYQIESQRAVKRLEEMAADGDAALQLVLPMTEMVGWLRQGVGELIRQSGPQLIQLLMEEEVKQLVGERSRPTPERTANRWGSERGYCVVMGQNVISEIICDRGAFANRRETGTLNGNKSRALASPVDLSAFASHNVKLSGPSG